MNNFEYFLISEQGLRDNNEDCVHVEMIAGGSDILAVIADGVGGENAGEVASMVTCKVISEYLAHLDNVGLEDLRMAVTAANNDIIELQKNPRYENMETVVSACVISPKTNAIHICHVGDTRIYALCNNGTELSKLTKDHSFIGRLLDEGLITEAEGIHHPKRNRIDRCLGSRQLSWFDDYIYAITIPLEGIDRLLLCSDGFYDVVRSDEMKIILAKGDSPEATAKTLVKDAYDKGSHDNISVIIIDK